MVRTPLEALDELRSGSITNHADVLGWFEGGRQFTVAQLAKEMSISPSTARRYIGDLQWGGWLGLTSHHPKTYARLPD
jgi:DNA-binding IclR family transcriptional regulator